MLASVALAVLIMAVINPYLTTNKKDHLKALEHPKVERKDLITPPTNLDVLVAAVVAVVEERA